MKTNALIHNVAARLNSETYRRFLADCAARKIGPSVRVRQLIEEKYRTEPDEPK